MLFENHWFESYDEVPAGIEADAKNVIKGLRAYNLSKAGLKPKPVRIFLKDPGGILKGGLLGAILWDWLYVETLWVSDEFRGKGYGSELLKRAEEHAKSKGCRHVHLDTFGFQAKTFYEKLGYVDFGVLANYPSGQQRYFMTKSLA